MEMTLWDLELYRWDLYDDPGGIPLPVMPQRPLLKTVLWCERVEMMNLDLAWTQHH